MPRKMPSIQSLFNKAWALTLGGILLAGCSACSSTAIQKKSETLQETPTDFQTLSGEFILIASTHNFYSTLETQDLAFPMSDQGHDLSIGVGGKKGLKSYIQILSERYPDELVLLDAGQMFQGESDPKAQEVIDHYISLPYEGLSLNTAEYILLKEELNYSHMDPPFIASNLIDIQTNDPVIEDFIKPYRIIHRKQMSIALLGMNLPSALTLQTPSKMTGKIWEDPVLSLLKVRNELQGQDIDFTIVLAHSTAPEEVAAFAKRVPPSSVDLIIVGGVYEGPEAINSIPILKNSGRSKYIQLIALKKNDDKIKATPQFTVKTCHRFYRATADCFLPQERDSLRSRQDKLEETSYETTDAIFLERILSDYF